jgi:protein SCO1
MADPVETPRRKLTGAVAPALAAAALAGLGALALVSLEKQAPPPPENCILAGAEQVGGPISLRDANGAAVTEADFAGAPALVYFGFTHCPDVCPTAMYALAEALAEPGGYDVRSALITVDPARDTPEVMGAYARTEGFPPGLVGLSGTQAQIDAATRAFRVASARAPGAAADAYNFDHSSLLYVMDGQWRTRAIVRTIGATPQHYAACIAAGLERD